MTPRILIIAGSDSGGGAGIQADIKTVTMMGGHAMTALTAVTAQNSVAVTDVMPVPPAMVIAQIDAVLDDLGADAVKIGMVGAAGTAAAVAGRLPPSLPWVFDPVMVASSGAALADEATIASFRTLMAGAAVATPNLPELAALTGTDVADADAMISAAKALAAGAGTPILAKGGHLPGACVRDALCLPDGTVRCWEDRRIETRHNHGTGCTLASAIATGLGRGQALDEAIAVARGVVREAMAAAPGLGAGHGPMGHDAIGGRMMLNQVTLPAHDYAASCAFYASLGLTRIVDAPPTYARFETPGGATLSIHVDPAARAGDAIVYLEHPALDRWVETLTAAGHGFDGPPRDEPWGWREVRLRDPAGNRLCLYQAGDRRRFPPWRVATTGEA